MWGRAGPGRGRAPQDERVEARPLPDGSVPCMSEAPVLCAASCRQDGLCPVRRCLRRARLGCAQEWATPELPWDTGRCGSLS